VKVLVEGGQIQVSSFQVQGENRIQVEGFRLKENGG
jgi:hypothetical protein